MSSTLLAVPVTSPDGRVGEAVLLSPSGDVVRPLVLSVHGSGGSPTGAPHAALAADLEGRGIPSLRVSTRQSGDGVNLDAFSDSVRDIEAAFWEAVRRGYRRIILHGHSLGSAQVAFLAANLWRPEIAGVILTGAFADLPFKTRHLLVGDDQEYRAMAEQARAAVAEGDPARILPIPLRWLQGQSTPVSARHFLSYRDTASGVARTVSWIVRIPYPILLVRDEHDPIVSHAEFDQLRGALHDSIAPRVTALELPSPEGSFGHGFVGSGEVLATTVADWIDTLEKDE